VNPLQQLRLVNDGIARAADHAEAERLRQIDRDEKARANAKRQAALIHEALSSAALPQITEPLVTPEQLERIREAGRLPLAQPEPPRVKTYRDLWREATGEKL